MPKVRDTPEAFDSVWLRTLVRRGDKLTALSRELDSLESDSQAKPGV